MTQSIEAAQAEMTPAGSEVTTAEQIAWLSGMLPFSGTIRRYKFDPRTPISDLAARLLVVSNALHGVR